MPFLPKISKKLTLILVLQRQYGNLGNIENWVYEKNQYLVNIDKKRTIFGICNQNEYNKPINYVLNLTRFYIYKCRINNKKLNIAAWAKEIKYFIHIEKK